jgi:DNA-binding NtrC family response regulator
MSESRSTLGTLSVSPLPNDRVLLVDDEGLSIADGLRGFFEAKGLKLDVETDPETAMRRLRLEPPAVVVLDLMFPSGAGFSPTGVDLLRRIKGMKAPPPVMMLTAARFDDEDGIEAGALAIADFVFRKVPRGVVTLAAMREWSCSFAESVRALADSHRVPVDLDEVFGFYVGRTEGMLRVARDAIRLAPTELSVLILGESGTGKERLARALHMLSGRTGSYEVRNCGAFPSEDLMKSDLFGYAKGAYTGARADRAGLFEAASGGTLFLDEIQALSLGAQQALLRVLQESKIKRVGEHTERSVDVRLLSATNGDLTKMLKDGELRFDFLERLNGAVLRLPSLRERAEDIVPLAQMFIAMYRPLNAQVVVSDEVLPPVERLLTQYTWPGNIRELENAVKRAIATANSNVLMPWQFEDLGAIAGEGLATPVMAGFQVIGHPRASGAFEGEPDLGSPAPTTLGGRGTDEHPPELPALTWQELRQYRGARRREVLESFMRDLSAAQGGRPPSGTDLAHRLGVSRSQLSQILRNCGVRLRGWEASR